MNIFPKISLAWNKILLLLQNPTNLDYGKYSYYIYSAWLIFMITCLGYVFYLWYKLRKVQFKLEVTNKK